MLPEAEMSHQNKHKPTQREKIPIGFSVIVQNPNGKGGENWSLGLKDPVFTSMFRNAICFISLERESLQSASLRAGCKPARESVEINKEHTSWSTCKLTKPFGISIWAVEAVLYKF